MTLKHEIVDPSKFPPPSAPPFTLNIQGMDEGSAQHFGPILVQYIQMISCCIDLERLDGVTVAMNYAEALAQLDLGYETSRQLTPTTEIGQGVAMTPIVKRDGVIKAHIVLHASFIWPLGDETHELWKEALYTLTHECAHVAVLKASDIAFPGRLPLPRYQDADKSNRGQIIDVCWDEYAVCRLRAAFGAGRTASWFEEVFVQALRETRDRANEHIRRYVVHRDHGRVLAEASGEYGNLMKFASYLLGHLDGAGLDLNAAPTAKAVLEGHWFAPFFERLAAVLRSLYENLGSWKTRDEFEPIGDIAREVIADGGVEVTRPPGGGLYVNVRLTPDTMPAC